MREVYQTIFKPPLGNCEQAAVASVLGLDLNDVPAFREVDKGDPKSDEGEIALIEFLKKFDLFPVHFEVEKLNGWTPTGYYLIQGGSPRGNYDHVVVGKNGKVVFDPYPGGEGELRDHKYYTVFIKRFEADELGTRPR